MAGETTPKSENVGDLFLNRAKQVENQLNQAVKSGDTKKAKELMLQGGLLYAQATLVTENQKLLADMMKVAPNLRKALAEELQKGGADAFTKMLELQSDANKKKQTMYQDEIDRMYQSRLATAEGPARLMANFKGFAILLQTLCGVDCSDFIKECDDRIEAEYAKIPKKNITGLAKLDAYTVDPTSASQALEIMATKAAGVASEIPQTATQSTQQAMQGATSALGGAPTQAQGQTPTAQPTPQVQNQPPVAKNYVVSALEQIVQEKKLITSDSKAFAKFKTELLAGVDAAAGVDGDKKSISAKDMDALTLNTQDALNKGGSHVDAAKAAEITKLAIERAKGMALAGTPLPAPALVPG